MAKSSSAFRKPLPCKALRWSCPPSLCEGVARDATLLETLGQSEAIEALRVGLELYAPGYNVFVSGLPLPARAEVVRGILAELSPRCALPPDRLYVNNFRHPERPRLIELPRGEGGAFARALSKGGEQIAESIRRLADDALYAKRREQIQLAFREEERKLLDSFEKECRDEGFAPGQVQVGPVAEPDILFMVGEQAVPIGDLDDAIRAGAVPAEKEGAIRATHRKLHERLVATLRKARQIASERQKAFEALERRIANRILHEVLEELRRQFPYPEVESHLDAARDHFIDRFPVYARALLEAAEAAVGRPDSYRLAAAEVLREFQVNLLLDAGSLKGVPLVIEHQPTWTNLFGQVERDVDARGNVRTDFLLIRAGSLLRADGGYLVLQARDVLSEEGVWQELKRVLRHGRLEISTPEALLQQTPTILHPDPIPLNAKVVLIGDEGSWYALREMDPDFAEIFKVKASFERDTPLDRSAVRRYASFFHRVAEAERRLDLDTSGLQAVVEEGVREAGRRGRLSVRFTRIADVVREADMVARADGAPIITGDHVRRAIHAAARRASVEERRVRDAIREGIILVQTEGARAGQVNGLAVYDFGDHRFGKVARITAAVGAGGAGVVNVERLAELSGASHDKGVMILSGYLRQTFCAERSHSFTATLVFEQSYGGVEGDSATCAEAFAVISALGRVPLRQDLAVTGSMNQHGDVQAVGGVNDKIEGFFEVCEERGLTGTQGVVIPRANVPDLMLRREVVEACAAGRFAIYAIDRIEEGIELFAGIPAGATSVPGRFAKGSVYAAVAARMATFPPCGPQAPGIGA